MGQQMRLNAGSHTQLGADTLSLCDLVGQFFLVLAELMLHIRHDKARIFNLITGLDVKRRKMVYGG